MKNRIEDLRNHLFAQLEKMSDCDVKELDAEISRATSMIKIAETIIDSARVENEFLEITGTVGTGFINEQKQLPI